MLKLIPLICGIIGLLAAFVYFSWVSRVNGKKADYQIIAKNNDLFHRDEWMTIIITIIVLSAATGVFVGWFACGLYAYGAAVTLLVEFAGSRVIARGRTELSLTDDNTRAFRISYRSGAAAGLMMTSFGLLALGAIFIPFKLQSAVTAIACYAFGASTVVIFNRTRFKPVADLYDSYIETVVSAIILSSLAVKTSNITSTFNTRTAAIFPLIVIGIGILASVIGSLFVRGRERSWEGLHINICVIVSAVLVAVSSAFLSYRMLQSYVYAVALVIGVVLGIATAMCSSRKMIFVPAVLFAIAMIVPYYFIGLYGIALAALGFVAFTAVMISINTFGLVTDTKSTIVNLGNGYSTIASALAVLAVFVAFIDAGHLVTISIMVPKVLAGLLIGVTMPLVYVTIYNKSTEDKDYSFILDMTAILIPVLIGLFLGVQTLGGLMGGLVTSGMITSFLINNFGSNNESNREGSYLVVSSVNTLIKYMTIVALVLAPVFSEFGGIIPN
ncbi:MAG: sodium/proton-translocating pyrophosphatase [Clostridiales bacterium]|nr:sodium/proton-translocating pyrophosphatase [Candidatus Crickella equi]